VVAVSAAAAAAGAVAGGGGWTGSLTLVAMERGSESAAVRRHRVGAERRERPVFQPRPEREALAQEPLEDAGGSGGGVGSGRTRKRSAGDPGTGLSEARAALWLALYLLALRALVQLSLQQLVLRGAAGLHGDFDARRARYRPRVPCPGCAMCARTCATPAGVGNTGLAGCCLFWDACRVGVPGWIDLQLFTRTLPAHG
jgi:hypothetical protein